MRVAHRARAGCVSKGKALAGTLAVASAEYWGEQAAAARRVRSEDKHPPEAI